MPVTKNQLGFATRCVHAGQAPDPTTGAVMMPIYTTSTYVQQSPGVHKGYDYARTKNPTRMAFERCIADLEGGSAAFAFASGLAAISTTLECLEQGSHIVAVDDLYGGSRRLFEGVRKRSMGLKVSYHDLTDAGAIEAAIGRDTRLIWVETPTNPLLKLVDLERVAAIAKKRGSWAVADNTFATPYIQRPLELGFDLVVHSTTKYLNGHSDALAGVLAFAKEDELSARVRQIRTAHGMVLGPFEAFLLIRGMRTLHLRVEAQCRAAMLIAQRLAEHPGVTRVLYPGLTSHPGHEVAARQMWGGFSGMLSIAVKGGEQAAIATAARVGLWKRATSLGGV